MIKQGIYIITIIVLAVLGYIIFGTDRFLLKTDDVIKSSAEAVVEETKQLSNQVEDTGIAPVDQAVDQVLDSIVSETELLIDSSAEAELLLQDSNEIDNLENSYE